MDKEVGVVVLGHVLVGVGDIIEEKKAFLKLLLNSHRTILSFINKLN